MAARETFGNRRIAIFMSDSFLRTGGATANKRLRPTIGISKRSPSFNDEILEGSPLPAVIAVAVCPVPSIVASTIIAVSTDDRAVARAGARDTDACRDAHRGHAGGDLEDQLIGRRVIQPYRPAIGPEDLLGCVHYFGQHSPQVERGRELARDG